MMNNETLLGCDGACQVSQRKGGWAFFDGEKMHSGTMTDCTNNQAEYTALIKLLEHLLKNPNNKLRHIVMDSQLVAYQVSERYAVRNEDLKPLYLKVKSLISQLGDGVIIDWVPRSHPLMMQIDAYAKRASQL